MKTRTLGDTDLEVSALGFGAMHLSLQGHPSDQIAMNIIHHVIKRGVTFIDTADSYCTDESDKHHNERLIRKALGAFDGDASGVVVATKGGLTRPEGAWARNGDPDYLRQTIRESYEALGGTAPIALWQHHAPDEQYTVKESLSAVREAVREGLIRYVGVSNYSVEQIEEAQGVVDVVSVQNQYNPWHRQPERDGVLAYCEEHNLTFLPWSPLGGRVHAKRLEDMDQLAALAAEKGISPQRLVLSWLIAKSPCILPIPGASRVSTANDSIAALDVNLTPEEVEHVEACIESSQIM